MQRGACFQAFSKTVLLLTVLGGCSSHIPQEGAISPARQLSSKEGVYHQVQPGQTLWSIARTYKTDVALLQQANQLPENNILYVGSKLYIPGAKETLEVASRCPCSPPAEDRDRLAAPTPPPAETSAAAFSPRESTSVAGVSFAWPVLGDVKRGTEQDETRRHHGINIYAPQGTPVQAAADGEVIFSGWGPEGYGRMVILRHQAGLVTIYAHNDNNTVNHGDRVQQGDRVAIVGRSGRIKEDSLHFEIRQNTVPVPPEKLLPPRSHSTVSLR